MRKAFTLIELVVVVAILALMLAVLTPSLSRAKQQAKIVAVNSDLYQIGLSLEMYMNEHDGRHPPTRQDCSMGWEDHQLPPELVEGGYLPAPSRESGMSVRMQDRFHPKNTYKYWSVGPLYQNGRYMPYIKASLYVPKGFPAGEGQPQQDQVFDDPAVSPVTWVIYSQGPDYDEWETLKELNGPVPRRTWYSAEKQKGLIVRMRLRQGRHIGSFEGAP
ncbi:MAG: type II secretion system protein [Sedimentisphaerales bacterium]|nr:type II secretion system protein [Sedimentisphaerales bacterium]